MPERKQDKDATCFQITARTRPPDTDLNCYESVFCQRDFILYLEAVEKSSD